ncbi:MAG: TetR/AcrR family transcriptional regulator [Myxococcota bacterium]|nr:TetR/AcrR family transcriptional regulator [Myxococcota bacterium]
MARPVNANADETRRRIREAASDLFAIHGISGASIREIARVAQVNPAMVSHYFGGKAGLYEACINRLYGQLDQGQVLFLEALASGDSIGPLIARTVRAAYALARENKGLIRLIMRDVLDRGELDPERRERVLGPFLSEGSRILATHTPRSPVALRIALQSIVYLTVRYTLCTDDELRSITGLKADMENAVADYLETFALEQLGILKEHAA